MSASRQRMFYFILVPALACGRGQPVRLVVGLRDTVVINDTQPDRIPVDATDRAGNPVPAPHVHFAWLSGDPISISDSGDVQCRRLGDAVVRARSVGLSTTVRLFCRPIRGFEPGNHNYGFFVGDQPRPLGVVGYGLDGRPITLLAARLQVRDSAIATLDHGLVVPRRAGTTTIEVRAGGFRTSYLIEVLQRATASAPLRPHQAFITRLRLTRINMGSWPIERGRYEMRFLPDSDARGGVLLTVSNANCSRYPDGGPHLSCVATDGTGRVLAGLAPGSDVGASMTGQLVIRRLDDEPMNMNYWFDVANYPLIR